LPVIESNFMSIYSRQLALTQNGVITLSDLEKALYDIRNTPYFIDCSTKEGRMKAYKKCDIVRTVIGRSSSFVGNLRIKAVDDDLNKVNTAESRAVIATLKRPNMDENLKEFYKKVDIQCRLHGKCYVHTKRNTFSTNHVVIPFQYVTPHYDNSTDFLFDRKVKVYKVNTGVESYEIPASEITVFNDGILTDGTYEFFGASRLESLSEAISLYVVAMEVLTELYGSGGARNLIAMGAKDHASITSSITKKEKENIYKRLKNWFGMRREQNRDLVLSGDAKVYPLTAKIVDMGIPQAVKEAKKAIYGAYEIPPELASVESSRFKTLPEARKEAYTQAAIPAMNYYMEHSLDMIGKSNVKFNVVADYSHLDFYQEAKREEAIAFAQYAQVMPSLVDSGIYSVEQAQAKLDKL